MSSYSIIRSYLLVWPLAGEMWYYRLLFQIESRIFVNIPISNHLYNTWYIDPAWRHQVSIRNIWFTELLSKTDGWNLMWRFLHNQKASTLQLLLDVATEVFWYFLDILSDFFWFSCFVFINVFILILRIYFLFQNCSIPHTYFWTNF